MLLLECWMSSPSSTELTCEKVLLNHLDTNEKPNGCRVNIKGPPDFLTHTSGLWTYIVVECMMQGTPGTQGSDPLRPR